MYTREKNTLILISLLKAHNIKKVIASSGNTNTAFVGSIQKDPFFEIYSCVDERSAAYLACGMSAESNDPIVLSCTGATAFLNYFPGLTEAYYRKLPVLAVSSTQDVSKVGHLTAQVTDRSQLPKDLVNFSVLLQTVKDQDDYIDCEIKVNKALLELKKNGGGPVHINLTTIYDGEFDVKALPATRFINRISIKDKFPELIGRVAIRIGSHKRISGIEEEVIEQFAITNNVPVFCDHTSGYYGKNRILFSLPGSQYKYDYAYLKPETLIHIGEVSGDYSGVVGKQTWRVNEDGELRDTFKNLKYIFQMPIYNFFNYYLSNHKIKNDNYFIKCDTILKETRDKIPELPFSNIWIASKLSQLIPKNSVVHFGILNSLRSWNFFDFKENNIETNCNVGGFGIDGCLSALVGASLVNENKLYFGVVGDLAFFLTLIF